MLLILPKSTESHLKWEKILADQQKNLEDISSKYFIDKGLSKSIIPKNATSGYFEGHIYNIQDAILKPQTNEPKTIQLKQSLSRLHGQFLLTLYDVKNEIFTTAIDKFGIKDCYYLNTNEVLIVSSTLKSILKYVNNPSVNPQAIFNYLYFHCIPSPLTIFNEIKKLEPGSFLTMNNNKVECHRYWAPEFKLHSTQSINELSTELMDKLTSAVSKTHPDDKTGSFLSGGLDSSTVTGIFSGLAPEKVDAYTMGFEEAGYDETEFAEAAAKHFDVKLNHYYVTPQDVAMAFSNVIQSCEEPFGNSSIIPTYLCAKFAKDQGKSLLLAGDGGDELFAGNERYLRQLVFNHYDKIPDFVKNLILEPLFVNNTVIPKLPVARKISRYIEQAKVPMPERMETYNLLNQFSHSTMFNDEFLQTIDTSAPVKAIEETYKVDTNADFLQQMLYSDWKFTLADNDLKKVNTACRLAGIDVAYPFLDDDVVEFSTHIPSNLLIKNNTLRYFYKETIKDFLPDEIINKKKHGFGLPFGEWLKKSPELQNHIYKNLNDFKSRNILKEDFIDEIIEKHRTQHAGYYGVFVWIIAVLEEWLSANIDKPALN